MKRTALVVDDDEGTRFVLKHALEDIGLDVVVAEDGADVSDLLVERAFDVLVLDLYMPGMNGFELLRRLRRHDPDLPAATRTPATVPVLVVSGESQPASIANATRLGADAYLVKPVDIQLLAQTVRQLLARNPSGLS